MENYLKPVTRSLASILIGALINILPLGSQAATDTHPEPVLDYHLNWDGKSTCLSVKVDYSPTSKDSTIFTFGTEGLGGQQDIFSVLTHIAGSLGDSVAVQPGRKTIVVYHQDNSQKQLVYQIDGKSVTDTTNRALYNELFRPVIKDGFLYIVSLVFMVRPVGHPAQQVGIQWDTVVKDVSYFMSYAPDANPLTRQVIPAQQSTDLLLIAGTDITTKSYQVGKVPYYFVSSKRDTINNIQAVFAPFFERYFPAIRRFWNDPTGTYYYICALPLLTKTKPMVGGFAWGPGFILKYAGQFDNSKRETIAHETAHYWIGHKVSIGSDSFTDQWFGEGFNDYVAVINLVQSGIFTQTDYVDYVNKTNFALHYVSPVRDSSNASIAQQYWRNYQFQKLPYRRGFVYAFYLDNQIRLATKNQHSLRDVLLTLFDRQKRVEASPTSLTRQDFIDAVSRYLPKVQVEREVAEYIVNGKPLDFQAIQLMPGFSVQYNGVIPVLSLSSSVNLLDIYRW